MDPFDLKLLFPRASQAFLEANLDTPHPIRKKTPTIAPQAQESANNTHADSRLPNSLPQRHKKKPLGCSGKGEEEGFLRTTVSFTGYRVRPLDPDNFAGSVKDLLDGLRHAGAISGDEPWKIILQTDQIKVSHYEDEKTVIQITYP